MSRKIIWKFITRGVHMVNIKETADCIRLVIEESITSYTVESLKYELTAFMFEDRHLELDLSKVDRLDGVGFQFLESAKRIRASQGKTLDLVCANDKITEVLDSYKW